MLLRLGLLFVRWILLLGFLRNICCNTLGFLCYSVFGEIDSPHHCRFL